MRNMMSLRRILVGVFVFAAVAVANEAAGAQQAVKVRKPLVTVGAPDENGQVEILGEPGAIRSADAVTVRIQNLATGQRTNVQVYEDGGFNAWIGAQPGQKVKIVAANRNGKSQGTFTVPSPATMQITAQSTTDPIVVGTEQAPQSDQAQGRWAPPAGASIRQMAVVVTVIDTASGEILASEYVSGVPKLTARHATKYRQIADNILRRCVLAIRSQLAQTGPPDRLRIHRRPDRRVPAQSNLAPEAATDGRDVDGPTDQGAQSPGIERSPGPGATPELSSDPNQ